MNVAALVRKFIGAEGSHRADEETAGLPKVLVIGSPNVGKTLLFNRLTGKYVTVSNYPGTTVEVSRARSRVLGSGYEVIDTPGMYSLSPITEGKQVAC
jgi:ferrous iron transport protein B